MAPNVLIKLRDFIGNLILNKKGEGPGFLQNWTKMGEIITSLDLWK